MTHEYTILFGGTVLAGGEAPEATAIAWAHDTVLLVGSDADVRAISRGDSHYFELAGAFVVPTGGSLEAGSPADFSVLAADPRVDPAGARLLAHVHRGQVTQGSLARLRPVDA